MPETRSAARKRSQERDTVASQPPKRPRSASKPRKRATEPAPIQRDPNARVTRATAATLGSSVAGPSSEVAEVAPKQPQRTAKAKKARTRPSMDKQPARGTQEENVTAGAAREGAEGQAAASSDPFAGLGATSSALQGLLRKLGGGLEDIMPHRTAESNQRMKSIMLALREGDDETAQLAALNELCELLAVSSEDALSMFPVDTLVPVLVQSLSMEHNPDIMLLAARAITHLADVLPASCSSIVRHGAVSVLCGRLLAIEYIDLAEQSLQALEKLSHEHPQSVLRQGGLLAVLSFLDFFQTSVQRTAVATAANMCRGLSSESIDAVAAAVPILTNLLQYEDNKVVDHACVALSRIADSFARSPAQLQVLCEHGLIRNAMQLVRVSETGGMAAQLSVSTYYGLLRLLGTCAAGSHSVAEALLSGGLPGTLRRLLATSTLFSSSTTSASSVLRSTDQLLEVVTLASNLLPPMPPTEQEKAASAASAATSAAAAAAAAAAGGRTASANDGPRAAAATARAEAIAAESAALTSYLEQNPTVLEGFARDLLPLMLEVYASTVQPQVRTQALLTLSKMVHYSTPDILRSVLASIPVSSFIAGLLVSDEPATLASALQLAQILMDKLPDVFRNYFIKEGVVHAIDELAAKAVPEEPKPATSTPSAEVAVLPPPPTRRITRSQSKDGSSSAAEEEAAIKAAREAAQRKLQAAMAAAAAARHPTAAELRAEQARHARAFQEAYFSADGGSRPETEGMQQLRRLCSGLAAPGGVAALLAALSDDSGISTFEFLNSGTVACLKSHLVGEDLKGAKKPQKLLARLKAFADATLAGAGGGASLLALVRKLLASLAAVENLPMPAAPPSALSAAYRYGGSYGFGTRHIGSLSTGLSALSQPFKLRLARGAGSDSALRDYSAQIVLIEPLATMSAIEEFLWPRVVRTEGGAAAAAAAEANGEQQRSEATAFTHRGGGPSSCDAQAAAEKQPQAAASDAATGAPRGLRRTPSQAQDIPEPPPRRATRRSAAQETAATAAPAADGPVGGGVSKARGRQRTRGRAADAVEREAPTALDPGPEFPPLVAPVDVDGGREHPGHTEDADDMDGHDEPVLMDGEDEEMFMLHHEHGSMGEDGDERDDGDMHDVEEDMSADEGEEDDDEDDVIDDEILDGGGRGEDDGADVSLGMRRLQVVDVDLGASDADVGAPAMAQSAPADSSAAASVIAAAANAAATAAQAGSSVPSRGTGRGVVTVAAAVAAANGASDTRHATTLRAAGGGAAGPRAGPGPSSYAAAAAAGAGRGADPKLRFSLNGRRLPPGFTILQAVQQAKAAAAVADAAAASAATLNGPASGGAGADGPNALALDAAQAARRARRMWDEVYTLTYESWDGSDASDAHKEASAEEQPAANPVRSVKHSGGHTLAQAAMDEILDLSALADLAVNSSTADVLAALKLLDGINRLGPGLAADAAVAQGKTSEPSAMALGTVPRAEFVSNKLAPKLAQQLKDVLALCGGSLPVWCGQLVTGARFLFPFDLRRRWFYCTAFGLARTLHYLQAVHAAEGGSSTDRHGREARAGRLTRQKVRVSRRRILDSAQKVLELYGGSRMILELEFFSEVGTGLGPTLEFYTLLAHELQKRALGMWRTEPPPTPVITASSPPSSRRGSKASVPGLTAGTAAPMAAQADVAGGDKAADYVLAPQGLFPAPLVPGNSGPEGAVLDRFLLLGRAAAKALQDSRLLDVPLSYVFYKIAMGRPVDLYDVRRVDAALGATLEKLAAAAAAGGGGNGRAGGAPMLVDGVSVEDLCLSFVLPGYPEYELRAGGDDTPVTSANVGEYLAAVVDATLGSGVAAQVEAFRSGFNEVFPLRHLECFYEDEIERLLCGEGETWTAAALLETIKFDHGYTRDSAPAGHLVRVLEALDAADLRRFLRFVTGSPRLPPGGIAALQPRLTVVRKHASGGSGGGSGAVGTPPEGSLGSSWSRGASPPGTAADGDLPSVMTCANYIKLPPYSSFQVCQERVLFAIREGQGSFDLS